MSNAPISKVSRSFFLEGLFLSSISIYYCSYACYRTGASPFSMDHLIISACYGSPTGRTGSCTFGVCAHLLHPDTSSAPQNFIKTLFTFNIGNGAAIIKSSLRLALESLVKLFSLLSKMLLLARGKSFLELSDILKFISKSSQG